MNTTTDQETSYLSDFDVTNNNEVFNASLFNVDAYLANHWGPKHLPLDVVIPITVVYVLIFVSGVVGNVAVCLVIIRNPSMHTATNCYLFSLAISDLTVLLFGKVAFMFKRQSIISLMDRGLLSFRLLD